MMPIKIKPLFSITPKIPIGFDAIEAKQRILPMDSKVQIYVKLLGHLQHTIQHRLAHQFLSFLQKP